VNDPEPLILVPAFNEERSVGAVVKRARALDYSVCVVDDGSHDRTSAVAEAAGAAVLTLPVNLGVGGALRCAFRYAIAAGYRVVVQVDGDGQHDPAEIPGLLRTMARTQADIVVGSRFLNPDPGYSLHPGRRLMMKVLARRASAAVGSRITDATSGFRVIRSPLLNYFADDYPVEYLGDTFEALVCAARRGAMVAEHPVTAARREHGRPSAGLLASGWYVIRVLAAAILVQNRAQAKPSGHFPPDPNSAETLRGTHASA
jgi:glycosyltransferase involved in cell wall biosynthesis